MRKFYLILVLLLMAFVAVPMLAGDGPRPAKVIGNPVFDPTYGEGGSGNGGNSRCYIGCGLGSNSNAYCYSGPWTDNPTFGDPGLLQCTAYNAPPGQSGPNGCVLGGGSCYARLPFGAEAPKPDFESAVTPGSPAADGRRATQREQIERATTAMAVAFHAILGAEDVANLLSNVEQSVALDPDADRAALARYNGYREAWNRLVPHMPVTEGGYVIIPSARGVTP